MAARAVGSGSAAIRGRGPNPPSLRAAARRAAARRNRPALMLPLSEGSGAFWTVSAANRAAHPEPGAAAGMADAYSARAPSKRRRNSFRHSLPPYFPIPPVEGTTRWHGTTMGIGLSWRAFPAARAARGLRALCHLLVGGDRAERDASRRLEHLAGEADRGERPVQPNLEPVSPSIEVLLQLAAHEVQGPGVLQDPGRERLRQVLDHEVGPLVRIGHK